MPPTDAELYPELFPDPDGPPPDGDPEDAEILAWCRRAAADQAALAERAARLGTTGALAVIAAASGRRGPGMPGSAQRIPGEYASDAAGFATGHPLDVAPGCLALMGFAEDAAGDDDRYAGASDDELIGALCAWDRIQATVSSRKHAAVAELIRRRPGPGHSSPARRGCRRSGMSSPTGSCPTSWPSPRTTPTRCSAWPWTWK